MTDTLHISAFLSEGDCPAVVRALCQMESIRFLVDEDERQAETLELWKGDADSAGESLDTVEEYMTALGIEAEESPPAPDEIRPPAEDLDEAKKVLREAKIEIEKWIEKKRRQKAGMERAEKTASLSQLMESSDLDLSRLRSLEWLYLICGTIEREKLDYFDVPLSYTPFVALPCVEEEDEVLLIGVTTREHRTVFERVMKNTSFSSFELPEELDTIAQGDLQRGEDELKRREEKLEQERRHLRSQWAERLKDIHHRLRVLTEAFEYLLSLSKAGDTFHFSVQVPAEERKRTLEILEDMTSNPFALVVSHASNREETDRVHS